MNVKELDVQIQKERDHMSELYAQIKECEKREERLIVERKAAEVSENGFVTILASRIKKRRG